MTLPTIDLLIIFTMKSGSIAAAIQSGIGNVAAGSAFAVVQSIAMGGSLASLAYGAAGAIGGFCAWLCGHESEEERQAREERDRLAVTRR